MGYVQTFDNDVDQLSGLSAAPGVGIGAGTLGVWGNSALKVIMRGYSMKRPTSSAAWKWFPTEAQARQYAGLTVVAPPVVPPPPVKPPSGGGPTTPPPVIVQPPVKPPVIGGPVTPPGIPIESKPGSANYRFENNLAYPLTAAGAANKPEPLTRTAGFSWVKKIFPIEKYGFIWEWKFVPLPSQVVVGPPIIAAPPPVGGTVTTPGGDRPNIIQPPPGGNVYPIGANDPAGEYYNITTGQVKTGRRISQPMPSLMKPAPVQWFSYPPDDNGNWIVRDEAVRLGYISMTGSAGVQVNPNIPVPMPYIAPGDGAGGVVTDKPLLAGMSPWVIGGLAVAALLLFGKKGKA